MRGRGGRVRGARGLDLGPTRWPQPGRLGIQRARVRDPEAFGPAGEEQADSLETLWPGDPRMS